MARYLIAADPLSVILPVTDTTIMMAEELLLNGHSVDYLDLSTMDWRQTADRYLGSLKVAKVEEMNLKLIPPLRVGPARIARVEEYDVILQRKDPPVDDTFIGHCRIFMQAPKSILQINNPAETWRVSEHELPLEFSEYTLPTLVAHSPDEFLSQMGSRHVETVVKPHNTFSGWGIEFFSKHTDTATLTAYWKKWAVNTKKVVIQDYSREVETIGDLRVLAFDGRVIGSVLRRPKVGSRLANLHQGGSAHPWKLTRIQSRATAEAGEKLAQRGLHLVGFDFIGDRLSEINITCPSALRQIDSVSGIKGQQAMMAEIEKLRQSGRRP
ncbi:MAG: hypothetical protein HYR96_00230 [Deltaproteobacteria bacterium]|nr:hypothetical protein [Deltaproteobacteria bacterium]MBI3293405.1 hypothetical protein [Deltaproteobacteria bacterium]